MKNRESIKNRSLSQREIDKLNAMAGNMEPEPQEIEKKDESGPATATETLVVKDPSTITGLVRYYNSEFNATPHLVVSAMIMEAAALIGKAIRDKA